jgi:hypothetical protein
MRTLWMLLADVVLGALLAGALAPLLVAAGWVQSQPLFWAAVACCVAVVSWLHGTFRRGSSE